MLWFGPMGHDVPRVSNPARGRWRASGSAAQQRLTRRWWCPPPIVPNHALIEVDRKRCLADAMGRADQPRLQVPNRAVRQWHHRRGAVPQGASERLHVLCSTVPAGRETWYRHADTSPATGCQHGRRAGRQSRGPWNPSGPRLAVRYCWQASAVANWRCNSRRCAGKAGRATPVRDISEAVETTVYAQELSSESGAAWHDR